MWLSVVVPALEEEGRIGACVRHVRELAPEWEVVVADGGSRDGTREEARAAGARVVAAPRGRGSQLRAGVAAARGEVLLLLHADVRLPREAPVLVAEILRDGRWVAGAFRVRHLPEGCGPVARRLLALADRCSARRRLPYGDQALFLRREVLERAGGIPDLPLMEDVELARRLLALGPIRRLEATVSASGRRFGARPLRTLLAWTLFPLLYRRGVPARRLARWYAGR